MSFTAETKPRVCLSVAPHHLDALDEIAERLERSRSWVAAQAFESFLGPQRNAEPPPAPCSRGIDETMATYSTTPEAAPHVRATLELQSSTLARAEEHTRRVAADETAMREAANRRTHEYLTGKVST